MKKILVSFVVILLLTSCGQARKAISHTIDVDTAFFNYEYFHSTYQDILSMEPKIENAWSMWKSPGLEAEQKVIFQTNYSGLVNIMQSEIAEYNAKSSMWNRSLFKDKRLPFAIHSSVVDGAVSFSFE